MKLQSPSWKGFLRTYTRGTNDDLITESIKLLNKLNETRFSVEDSLEVFSELETQIESWLGGPKKGECGNLFNGIILSQGNWLSKKGQISIQSYNMTPTLFQAKTSESEMDGFDDERNLFDDLFDL